MLLEECAKGGVDVRCGQPVREVTHADGAFGVTFGDQNFTAPNLVIATGGPSIPKMGATGFAYDLARRFGLKIVEPRPRSEEHTSELQSLMRSSNAVFCLKKKQNKQYQHT